MALFCAQHYGFKYLIYVFALSPLLHTSQNKPIPGQVMHFTFPSISTKENTHPKHVEELSEGGLMDCCGGGGSRSGCGVVGSGSCGVVGSGSCGCCGGGAPTLPPSGLSSCSPMSASTFLIAVSNSSSDRELQSPFGHPMSSSVSFGKAERDGGGGF